MRQLAYNELAMLGAVNLEELQRLIGAKDDLEQTSRAKQIITQWLEDRATRIILVRNIFYVWKASSNDQQLMYAKQLVTAIQKFPAEVNVSEKRQENSDSTEQRQQTIRLHEDLFPDLVKQLKSHNTPAANLVLKSFLREESTILVINTIQLISDPDEGPEVAKDLIRLAEGKDKAVALKALSYLSNWNSSNEYRTEIIAMLKRLYASKDEEIALQAAIISCYAGDWSGYPMLLEATKNPDKKIALKAIGQLADWRFRSRAKEIVPLIVPHLQTDDLNLLSRTIETLGTYKGSAGHILPFLDHKDKNITYRTILALNEMGAIEAIVPLEELLQKTTDKIAKNYINEALLRLKRLQQKR